MGNIKNFNLAKNPYLLFLPCLVLYIVLILIFSKTENFGDEIRYITYAHNLTHGFYSPPYPHIDLGNGPGYSLILTPFVAFNTPLIFLKLLNAVFYYISVVFLFKCLKQIVPFKFALICSLFWALYPNVFEQMPYTLPEIFACSLIPLFLFCTLNGFKSNTSKKALKYLIISGLIFGYLALTKPIFGYVLTFVMVLSFFIWLTNRKSANYKKTIVIFVVGFITTLPYLAYTYNLTGKVFYWSSFGGNNLYWMSSPFKEEYGDYYRYPFTNHYNDRIPESIGLIKLNHEKDFLLLSNDPEVRKANTINGVLHEDFSIGTKQDELLKQIALENITSHPLKFLQNCISNAGRILFNYPGSYVLQKPSTLRRLPVNGTLIVLCVFCFIPTLLNWKKIIFPIRLLLFLSSVYLGASLLGSAEPRMFTMIVPILLFWIAYMLQRTVKVKLKFSAE